MKYSKSSEQWVSSLNDDEPQTDNYKHAIVNKSFQSLQQITVPAAFSLALEQSVRAKTRIQKLKKQRQRAIRISLSSAAAIILIFFGAISFAAFHSIPGDSLYSLKSFEQQAQYAVMVTGEQKTQTARAQLLTALQDLQQEIQQGRPTLNIEQALQVVQSYTQRYLLNYSQLSASAQMQEKQYYIQIKQLEVSTLTTILRRQSINLKSSATSVMGLLNYGSISLSGYKLTVHGLTIHIKFKGNNFNPAITVITKPAIPFAVTSIQSNAIKLTIDSSNWSSPNIQFALINPDNETVAITISKPVIQNTPPGGSQQIGSQPGSTGAAQPANNPVSSTSGNSPENKHKGNSSGNSNGGNGKSNGKNNSGNGNGNGGNGKGNGSGKTAILYSAGAHEDWRTSVGAKTAYDTLPADL